MHGKKTSLGFRSFLSARPLGTATMSHGATPTPRVVGAGTIIFFGGLRKHAMVVRGFSISILVNSEDDTIYRHIMAPIL
jgi:hypothetical protein